MTMQSDRARDNHLEPYPFDWSGLEDFDYERDQSGIPMVDLGEKYGLQYNPITISQFGLFNLQKYAQTSQPTLLDCARICVRWLCANFQAWREDIGAWVYNYDLKFYGPKAPWISGMAQGQGISLLLRAHQIEADHTLLEMTQRAYQAFLFQVEDGGVLRFFPDGAPVFEEFTTTMPSCVLNGHMFALLGISDYARYCDDNAARSLFDSAASGLATNLALYDTGFWNLYDLHPTRRLASRMYVIVHVRLLNILAELTGNSIFADYARKWSGYSRNYICRCRFLIGKIHEKIRLHA